MDCFRILTHHSLFLPFSKTLKFWMPRWRNLIELNYKVVEHDTLTNFFNKHLNNPSSRHKSILKVQCNHGLVWSWFMRHYQGTNVVFQVSDWLFRYTIRRGCPYFCTTPTNHICMWLVKLRYMLLDKDVNIVSYQ